MGRIDDVLNVAGHRLGTMEIESALVAHARVAEAAVVGRAHEIKGESVFAYVVLKGQRPSGAQASALASELRDWVGAELSPIAKPDEIRIVELLPKTRSGKIMRRLLRAIARGEEITQDVSTLENPAILDQLRGIDTAPAAVKAKPAQKRRIKARSPAKPRIKAKRKVKPVPKVKAKSKTRVRRMVKAKPKPKRAARRKK
jgi:AMP-binding enzyme C-terminal domain